MTAVACIVILTLSNFFWQAATTRDWESATERSFFQAWAVVIYVMLFDG